MSARDDEVVLLPVEPSAADASPDQHHRAEQPARRLKKSCSLHSCFLLFRFSTRSQGRAAPMEHSAAASPAHGSASRPFPSRPPIRALRSPARCENALRRIPKPGRTRRREEMRQVRQGFRRLADGGAVKDPDGHEPPRSGLRRASPGQGERLRLRTSARIPLGQLQNTPI